MTAWQFIAAGGILALFLLGLVAIGQPDLAAGILFFFALIVVWLVL